MVVADHVQRVVRPNFAASWDEIGDENQVEETFALSTMKDIPGWSASHFYAICCCVYGIVYGAGSLRGGVNYPHSPSH